MTKYEIDINCDLGEIPHAEVPHHIQLLEYISSCNIATGFHAGDPYTIFKTIREAHRRGVAIGVHPSYPDKKGFGRESINMSSDELYASLIYQTSAISGFCKMAGSSPHHIKLHGALYHDAHQREEIAKVVIRFMNEWPEPLMIYGQPGSILEEMARDKEIRWVPEGFIDRRYQADGNLMPRKEEHALLDEPEEAIHQALDIIRNQKVRTIDHQMVPVNAQTLCIHGDHSGSLQLARQLQKTLNEECIAVTSPDL